MRDADKVDILRITRVRSDDGALIALDGVAEGDDISNGVLSDILMGRTVEQTNIQNDVDWLFFRLSWLFDINFEATFKMIDARGDHAHLKSLVPDTPRCHRAVQAITIYADSRLNGASNPIAA